MIFNSRDSKELVALNAGIGFVVGFLAGPAICGITPLAGAICCLLQPIAFKVSSYALEKLSNHMSSSLNLSGLNQKRLTWAATLLVPSLITWHQGYSINPFAALAVQLASIGALCILRNVELIRF